MTCLAPCLQSEVYGYCIPVFGKGVVYDVPPEERREQFRILGDALKSSKLDTYVPMMVQEAEDFFGSWGKEGVVQLKDELSEVRGGCLSAWYSVAAAPGA